MLVRREVLIPPAFRLPAAEMRPRKRRRKKGLFHFRWRWLRFLFSSSFSFEQSSGGGEEKRRKAPPEILSRVRARKSLFHLPPCTIFPSFSHGLGAHQSVCGFACPLHQYFSLFKRILYLTTDGITTLENWLISKVVNWSNTKGFDYGLLEQPN